MEEREFRRLLKQQEQQLRNMKLQELEKLEQELEKLEQAHTTEPNLTDNSKEETKEYASLSSTDYLSVLENKGDESKQVAKYSKSKAKKT